MGVTTERFIRKPLYVDAVRVKADNFDEIVLWCQGEVQTDEVPGTGTTKKYIKVRVHNPKNPRQTKAFIGDWILYTERGYKVYTNKAFRQAFDQVEGAEPKVQEIPPASVEKEQATAEEIREKLPNVQDRRPKVLDDVKPESISAVPEEPSQETGVQPIQEVRPGEDLGSTPQGEQIEVVEATPAAIANAVNEQQPPVVDDEDVRQEMTGRAQAEVEETMTTATEPVSEQPPQDAAAGKYVLSEKEQQDLGPEGVRELISSGEAVLSQDLAESA